MNKTFGAGIAYAILTGLCWAVLAIGLKYTLRFSSPGTIVWVRMIVAFGSLFFGYLIFSPKTLKKIFSKPSLLVILAGVFLSCNYFAYMKGIELTNASNSQIMIQIGPLTLLLFGVFYFKEQIRMVQWIGVLLAIAGFGFYNWDQILVSLDPESRSIYIAGNLWLFFAAVTWAIFAVLQKVQLSRSWTPQMINLLIYLVCCFTLYPTADLHELAQLNAWQWFVMILLGLNTVVAYGALGEALHRIPASYVSLIVALNPILTIVLVKLISFYKFDFINDEPILWRGYLGATLVVLGVSIAVSLRARQKKI
jgi:drug/metabolite transporter (DMT)-like permease